jgi:HPt (histidine-containing phosphotransfer) domain-containing protein
MIEQPNLIYINQLSRGDKAFEKKLLAIIKEEFPLECKIYLENIRSNNFRLAAANVHKIKHKISILGLERSYAFANEFEIKLKEGDNSLLKEFDEILQVITKYLNKL